MSGIRVLTEAPKGIRVRWYRDLPGNSTLLENQPELAAFVWRLVHAFLHWCAWIRIGQGWIGIMGTGGPTGGSIDGEKTIFGNDAHLGILGSECRRR